MPLPFFTYQHAGLRVEIVYDEQTGSPRDMDPVGTVIGWRSELKLGERQVDLECTSREAIVADLRRDGAKVILPLYYSSHGPQCRLAHRRDPRRRRAQIQQWRGVRHSREAEERVRGETPHRGRLGESQTAARVGDQRLQPLPHRRGVRVRDPRPAQGRARERPRVLRPRLLRKRGEQQRRELRHARGVRARRGAPDGVPRPPTLGPVPENLLWVVVPDVVAGAAETYRYFQWLHPSMADLPLAFAVQDGAGDVGIPWDAPNLRCLFLGGSDKYKLSSEMAQIAAAGKARGRLPDSCRRDAEAIEQVWRERGVEPGIGCRLLTLTTTRLSRSPRNTPAILRSPCF